MDGRLDSPWLDQFRVLVLPDGDGYDKVLDESATASLKRWVQRGRTLIAVGGALDYLGSDAVGLLATRRERQVPEDGDDVLLANAVLLGPAMAGPVPALP